MPSCVSSPEAGRPDAALHPRGEHVQPLVCALGPGRGHALQRPGETVSGFSVVFADEPNIFDIGNNSDIFLFLLLMKLFIILLL